MLADGFYTIDKDIADNDADVDEAIAYAATFSFAAPVDRRGDRITADGKTLRFSDVDFDQLRSQSGVGAGFRLARGLVGALIPVPGYSDGVIQAGTSFGQAASGIRRGRRRRLSRPRRVRARGCRERAALSAACRHRWRARRRRGAHAERSAHGAAVGARCRESRPRADSPAAGLAGARDHLGRRYARRDSRHRAHARCAGVRH